MGSEVSSLNDYTIEKYFDTVNTVGNQWSVSCAINDEKEQVSLFQCSTESLYSNTAAISHLKKSVKNLKTLRHPFILKFLDFIESGSSLCIVTEPVCPIEVVLDRLTIQEISCGLHNIVEALDFLHTRALVTHNNVSSSTIFVARDGTWKLGGFECMCQLDQLTDGFLIQCEEIRNPGSVTPEEKDGPLCVEVGHARDVYGFGVFATSILEHLDSLGDIARSFEQRLQTEFLCEDPRQRLPIKSILDDDFFRNDLIEVLDFLQNLTLKTDKQRRHFFQECVPKVAALPAEVVVRRILPLLTSRIVLLDEAAGEFLLDHLFTPREGDADASPTELGKLATKQPTSSPVPSTTAPSTPSTTALQSLRESGPPSPDAQTTPPSVLPGPPPAGQPPSVSPVQPPPVPSEQLQPLSSPPGQTQSLSPGQPPSLAPGQTQSLAPGKPLSLPPGQPPSLPPGQPLSLPPGQPPSLPPGQPPSLVPGQPPSLPPGQPPSFSHGQKPSYLPPEQQPPSLPPGQQPPSLPPGQQPPYLPPGQQPSYLPLGQQPPSMPPGQQPPSLPPGQLPPLPPGQPPSMQPGGQPPSLPPVQPPQPPAPVRAALYQPSLGDTKVTPLLPEREYREHLVPRLLQIFKVRDLHIRLVLLRYLPLYVRFIDPHTLQHDVLPEMLVGLREEEDAMVQTTLVALAGVVPVLGGAAVIGGSRHRLFRHGLPKNVATEKTSSLQASELSSAYNSIPKPAKSPPKGSTTPSPPSVRSSSPSVGPPSPSVGSPSVRASVATPAGPPALIMNPPPASRVAAPYVTRPGHVPSRTSARQLKTSAEQVAAARRQPSSYTTTAPRTEATSENERRPRNSSLSERVDEILADPEEWPDDARWDDDDDPTPCPLPTPAPPSDHRGGVLHVTASPDASVAALPALGVSTGRRDGPLPNGTPRGKKNPLRMGRTARTDTGTAVDSGSTSHHTPPFREPGTPSGIPDDIGTGSSSDGVLSPGGKSSAGGKTGPGKSGSASAARAAAMANVRRGVSDRGLGDGLDIKTMDFRAKPANPVAVEPDFFAGMEPDLGSAKTVLDILGPNSAAATFEPPLPRPPDPEKVAGSSQFGRNTAKKDDLNRFSVADAEKESSESINRFAVAPSRAEEDVADGGWEDF